MMKKIVGSFELTEVELAQAAALAVAEANGISKNGFGSFNLELAFYEAGGQTRISRARITLYEGRSDDAVNPDPK